MRKFKSRYGNSIYWIAALTGAIIFSISMLLGVLTTSKNYSGTLMQLENDYQRSFAEMVDSVSQMEANLSKMMVSSNEEQSVEMASEVRLQAQMAQSSLNQLPISAKTAHDMNKFFNQIGDWCASYSSALLLSGETSIYEDKIEDIYAVTRNVSNELNAVSSSYQNGKSSILGSLERRGVRNALNFALSTDALNGSTVDYPELVYDGVFSDPDGLRCYKALENLPVISKPEAIAKAKELFSDMGLKNVKLLNKSTEPDAFELSGDINGGSIYLSISENGGKLLSATTNLIATRERSDSYKSARQRSGDAVESGAGEGDWAISEEMASQLAKAYAERCDYCDDLVPVWFRSMDGIAYVNLAPTVGGVIYYPDLVKVKVGLDDGKLIAVEATGFCKNNCSRSLTPSIEEKTAKGLISPKLEIVSSRLVLIPLEGHLARMQGEKERLCYEIACKYRELDYLVYVDANSGKQLNILREIGE